MHYPGMLIPQSMLFATLFVEPGMDVVGRIEVAGCAQFVPTDEAVGTAAVC